MRAPDVHPIWCNVQHQSGADPHRQFHNHLWRGNDGARTRWRAEVYPMTANAVNPSHLSIRLRSNLRGEFFWMWPTATDARVLGESLYELSELALRGQA